MPAKPKPSVDPALLPLIRALARLAVEGESRETAEAAPEVAELRSVLGLDNDLPAWKKRAEALMATFYRRVPEALSMTLRGRLRLVISAARELGRDAPDRKLITRAGELAGSAAQTNTGKLPPRRTGACS